MVLGRLRSLGRRLKREVAVYRLVLKDRRTPWLGKLFLGMAVGYVLLPFDIIPDFIPVVGYLDDAIIVPGRALLGLALIPREVVDDCRRRVMRSQQTGQSGTMRPPGPDHRDSSDRELSK